MKFCALEATNFVAQGRVNPDGIEVFLPAYTKKIIDGDDLTTREVADIISFLFTNIRTRKQGWENPENLSNERIMWQAQGGCQSFKWSHDIVEAAIKSGEISQAEVDNYISPEEFISNGGSY